MNARKAMTALANGEILRSETNGLRYRMKNDKVETYVPNLGWIESGYLTINDMKKVRP